MKAAVLRAPGARLAIEEVALEPPRAGEAQVRIAASGVCRSDHHLISGVTPHPLPVVPGHEGAGIVEAVGPGVSGVAAGDHVVLSWMPACGECFYCQGGLPAQCETHTAAVWDGAMTDGTTRLSSRGERVHHYSALSSFAERAIVPASCCVVIRPDLPLETAALVGCAVTTGVGAVQRRAKVEPGSSVAVFGCGGVGMNIVQAAALAGAETIIAVDRSAAKLGFAPSFGATHTRDASSGDPVAAIRSLTQGRGADYVFEAIGSPSAMTQAIDATRRGGMTILVGLGSMSDSFAVGAGTFTRSDKILTSAYYGGCDPRRDMPAILDLYRAGKLKLDELITKRRPLDEINEAFADMERGDVIRSLVVF